MVKQYKATFLVGAVHGKNRVTMTVKRTAEDDVKAYSEAIDYAKVLQKELGKTVILKTVVEA